MDGSSINIWKANYCASAGSAGNVARAQPCKAGRAAPAQDPRVSQACPWPRVGSVPSRGSLTVYGLHFPPWELFSEPTGFAFIITISHQDHKVPSPSPEASPQWRPPCACSPDCGAPVHGLDAAVRMCRAAQRPTGAGHQELVRPADPPTVSRP